MQLFKTYGEKILKRTPYGCRVEGTTVVMTIGTTTVSMDYTTALRLGTFLRYSGKVAKKAAGDVSKQLNIVADLTYENQDEFNAALSVDRKSVYVRR